MFFFRFACLIFSKRDLIFSASDSSVAGFAFGGEGGGEGGTAVSFEIGALSGEGRGHTRYDPAMTRITMRIAAMTVVGRRKCPIDPGKGISPRILSGKKERICRCIFKLLSLDLIS